MGDEGEFWRTVKAVKKANTKAVVTMTQSPMNSKRWCLGLACGHDVWVTRAAKPQLQGHFCEKCATSSTRAD